MEPVSFAVGLAGLSGAFSACLDCFERIQFARSFGEDYSKYLLRLDLAELRMTRWGASLGIDGKTPHLTADLISADTKEFDTAKELLGEIEGHFKAAEEISSKYKDKKSQLLLDENDDLDEQFKELHVTIRGISLARQKKAKIGQKIKWALYQKGKFLSMLEDLERSVNQLVALFPVKAVTDRQVALCEQEVGKVKDGDALKLLKEAAGEDELLINAVAREQMVRGHIFKDGDFSGSAHVHAGDNNSAGRESKGHYYRNFKATDNVEVHLGNVNN